MKETKLTISNKAVKVDLPLRESVESESISPAVPKALLWHSDLQKLSLGNGSDVSKSYVDAADATLVTAINAQKGRIDTLVTGAPQALDTLAEIAAQLASDESGTAAILATQQQHTQQLAEKAADTTVVHKTGTENISGVKTFADNVGIGNTTLPYDFF